MIATLSVDRLLSAAARVGVVLKKTDSGGNLYLWHTPELDVVYIGKSASDSRVRDETAWMASDPKWEIFSGIITLLRVNKAELQPLRYEPDEFDPAAWRELSEAHHWNGPAIDYLHAVLESRPPTPEEVERLLIRIGVRYGTPLGNSQFASQWEGPIGKITDTLAAISVGGDEDFIP